MSTSLGLYELYNIAGYFDTRTTYGNFINEKHRWKGATRGFALQDVSTIVEYPHPSNNE